jgi:hypothetical protein
VADSYSANQSLATPPSPTRPSSPRHQGALTQPSTSWVWGLKCAGGTRRSGFGRRVLGFFGEGAGFGDTAADSVHRMADPEGIRGVDAQLRPLACLQIAPALDAVDARPGRQFTVTAPASGLMWANMLRPFQLGKARTSHDGPSSWIRESRVTSAQESCPACHFTNASASAVM